MAAGLAVGAVKGLRVLLEQHASERARVRAENLARALSESLDEMPEEEALEIDPAAFGDLVFQSYRAALDALDPAVVPFMGRLTARYCGRPVDPFFRGAARTLRDLTPGGLSCLRRMVLMAFDLRQTAASEHDTWVFVGVHGGTTYAVVRPGNDHSLIDRESEIRAPESFVVDRDTWEGVFRLMTSHWLAEDLGGRERGGNETGIVVHAETMTRLHELLGGRESAS